jgi:hypothetical protein
MSSVAFNARMTDEDHTAHDWKDLERRILDDPGKRSERAEQVIEAWTLQSQKSLAPFDKTLSC